jgi:hypothetical protein
MRPNSWKFFSCRRITGSVPPNFRRNAIRRDRNSISGRVPKLRLAQYFNHVM